MKSARIATWPTLALVAGGLLLAALSGCTASGGGMGHHAGCPMCNLGGQGHAGPHGCPPGHCQEDPADHVAEYHRQQTARQAWRSSNVRHSLY
ncbi:MAG: hypothetical protein WD069_02060 [Planctomycetales bacterium]